MAAAGGRSSSSAAPPSEPAGAGAGSSSTTSGRRGSKAGLVPSPTPPDAFDAAVRAANPSHPDHQAWLERYGPGASNKNGGSIGRAASLHGDAAGSRRARAGSSARSPVMPMPNGDASGAQMPEPASGREGAPVGSTGVAGSTTTRRRKKKKSGDKGKRRAAEPPVPPPRTTSVLAQPNSLGDDASPAASSLVSSLKSPQRVQQHPIPAAFTTPRRSSMDSRFSPMPAPNPEDVPPLPNVRFAATTPTPPAAASEAASSSAPTPAASPSRSRFNSLRFGTSKSSPLKPADVHLAEARAAPVAPVAAESPRSGGALRRSLDGVMAPFRRGSRDSASSRGMQEAAVLARMAALNSDHASDAEGESSATFISPSSSAAFISPSSSFSHPAPGLLAPFSMTRAASLDAAPGAYAHLAGPAGVALSARSKSQQEESPQKSTLPRGASAARPFRGARPLSSVRDARESGTEAEGDDFFDAQDDEVAPSSPNDTDADDASPARRSARKRSPKAAGESATFRKPDEGKTHFAASAERRRSLDSLRSSRASRRKAEHQVEVPAVPPLVASGMMEDARDESGGESSADELMFANGAAPQQQQAALDGSGSARRKRSLHGHGATSGIAQLQRERELIAQAQAMRRARMASLSSLEASPGGAAGARNQELPLPGETPSSASPAAPPVPSKSPAQAQRANGEAEEHSVAIDEASQRLRAVQAQQYFIPPVYPRAVSSGTSTPRDPSVINEVNGVHVNKASSSRSLSSNYSRPTAPPTAMPSQDHASKELPRHPFETVSSREMERQGTPTAQTSASPILSGSSPATPATPSSAGRSGGRRLAGFFARSKAGRSASQGAPNTLSPPVDETLPLDDTEPMEHLSNETEQVSSRFPVGLGIEASPSGLSARRQRSESYNWRSRVASLAGNRSGSRPSPSPTDSPARLPSRERMPSAAEPPSPGQLSEGGSDADANWRRQLLSQAVGLSFASGRASPSPSSPNTLVNPVDSSKAPRLSIGIGRPNFAQRRGASGIMRPPGTPPDLGAKPSATFYKTLSPSLLHESSVGYHEADDLPNHVGDPDEDSGDARDESSLLDAPALSEGMPGAARAHGEGLDAITELQSSNSLAARLTNGTSHGQATPHLRLVRSSVDLQSGSQGTQALGDSAAGAAGAASPTSFGDHRRLSGGSTAPPPPLQLRSPSSPVDISPRGRTTPGTTSSMSAPYYESSFNERSFSADRKLSSSANRPSFAELGNGIASYGSSDHVRSPKLFAQLRKGMPSKLGGKSSMPRMRGISSSDMIPSDSPGSQHTGAGSISAVEDATRLLAVQADLLSQTPSPSVLGTPATFTFAEPDSPFARLPRGDAPLMAGFEYSPRGTPGREPFAAAQSMAPGATLRSPSSSGSGSYDTAPLDTRYGSRMRTTSMGARSTKSRTHVTSPEIDAFSAMLREAKAADEQRLRDISRNAAASAAPTPATPAAAAPVGH